MTYDDRHRPWIVGCGAVAFASAIAYVIYVFRAANGPTGGSVMGLIYGSLAAGVIVFESMLSLRKKYPASPFGRVQSWLRAHLYLGLLSLLLILFHTGFRWGQGLAWVLMGMMALVGMSGIIGAALQVYIPRRMTELVSRETIYGQIPRLLQLLRSEADERVEFVTAEIGFAEGLPEGFPAGGKKFYFDESKRKSAQEKIDAITKRRKASAQIAVSDQATLALKTHYLQEIRPFLADRPARFSQRLLGEPESLEAYFRHLRTILPVETHVVIDDLRSICDERRQLAIQARLHRLLHGWLYVHVPLSMGALVLTLIHAVVSLRY